MAKYDTVLIRYGELNTKGKNRNLFVQKLLNNIKAVFSDMPELEYRMTYDRIYIKINGCDTDIITERLSKVFGISSFSLTQKVKSDIDEIVEACYQAALECEGTFKVKARRHDKSFPLISDEINRAVATKILKESDHKVDVHNPDFMIYVEVQSEDTYITCNKFKGAGGFPVGINGKVLLCLSGGIDSPVAAYYLMKRGIEVEAVHYASPPYTSNNARQKVLDLASIVSGYQGKMRVHVINFTDLQKEIYKACNESYAITIMRRMMMRIAQDICEKNNCLAIATGESVGQVASQTLESMVTINDVVHIPLLRPLVCFDKEEIVKVAREIGTYETSILPYEDCCTIFDPKNPVTKPKINKAEYYEGRFDWQSFVNECLEKDEIVICRPKSEREDYL